MNAKRLAEENIKLAEYIAEKFVKMYDRYDKEEYLSVAYIGLMKEANKFDESKGYKFSTLAYRSIQNEILNLIRYDKKFNKAIGVEKDGHDVSLNEMCNEEEEYIDLLVKDITDKTRFEVEDFISRILLSECCNTEGARARARRSAEIIKLCLLDGYRESEIAPRYGMSRQSVEHVVRKFKHKAKKYII